MREKCRIFVCFLNRGSFDISKNESGQEATTKINDATQHTYHVVNITKIHLEHNQRVLIYVGFELVTHDFGVVCLIS